LFVERKRQFFPGSLTVEAALSVTVFLFTVIFLSVPMELIDTQRKVQTVLEAVARELSWQVYGQYSEKEEDGEETVGKGLLTEAGLQLYLQERIRKVGGRKIQDVSCFGSRITEDGEWIDLKARYRLKLPFPVFSLESVALSSRSRRRGWIGSEGGRLLEKRRDGDGRMYVYVGKNSSRYHRTPDCHYISNQISAVSLEEAKTRRNVEGKIYKPCHVCGELAQQGGVAYLLPGGEYYHGRNDCSSLACYVRKVPLSEVKYLGPCSYCGGEG
jgi:hypothetical protein